MSSPSGQWKSRQPPPSVCWKIVLNVTVWLAIRPMLFSFNHSVRKISTLIFIAPMPLLGGGSVSRRERWTNLYPLRTDV
ncbi:hypothetical protein KCP74_17120 [Salmonella enterica subsp. enterica]|nr:hypothetical protein KCP74_17120 [Salmonella enterica subsp. enterica]